MKLFVALLSLLLLLAHPCSGDEDLKNAMEDMALNEVDAPEEPTAQQTRTHIDVRHPNGRKVAPPRHEHGHRLSPAGYTDDPHPSSIHVSHLQTSSATRRHPSGRRTPVRAHHSGTYKQYPRRPIASYPHHYHQQSGTYGVSPRYPTVSRHQGRYGSYGYPLSLYPATNLRGSFPPDSSFSAAVPRPYRPLSAPTLPSTPVSPVHPVAPIAPLPFPPTPVSDLPHTDLPSVGVSRPFSPQLPENALVNQVDVRFSPNDVFVNPVNQFDNLNDPFVNPVSPLVSPNPFAVPRDLFRDPSNFVYPESPFVNLSELEGPRDAHFNVNHHLTPAGSSFLNQKVPFVSQYDPSIVTFDGSLFRRQPFSTHDGSFPNHGVPPFVNNDNAFVNLNTPVVDRDESVIDQGAASSYINRYTPYTPIVNQGSTFGDRPFVNQESSSFVNPYTSLSNAFNPLVNQGVSAFSASNPFAAQDNIVNKGVSSFDGQVPNAVEDDFVNQEVQPLDDPFVPSAAAPSLVSSIHYLVKHTYPYSFLPPYATSSHFTGGESYGNYYTRHYKHYGR